MCVCMYVLYCVNANYGSDCVVSMDNAQALLLLWMRSMLWIPSMRYVLEYCCMVRSCLFSCIKLVFWQRNLGVDVDELLCSQPDCGEMALDVVDKLVRSSAVDIIVVDSVAALVPRG